MIVVYPIEAVDRSLYEVIRLKLVELGYLPDITKLSKVEYDKQLDIIAKRLGYGVSLFGVGTAESRGTKSVVTISIDRKDIRPSGLGNKSIVYRRLSNGKYAKMRQPITASDVGYEIRLFTNSVVKERLFEMMLLDIIGHGGYIPVEESYRENKVEMFYVQSTGSVDVSSTDVREKLFTYTVSDVFVGIEHKLQDVTPVTEVRMGVEVRKSNGEVDTEKEYITIK